MKRPTITDIAHRAGVSKGAVSYALNNQPGVSDATRQRILAIAGELGFKPSTAARALSDARARAVGLIMSRPAPLLGIEPWFMGLMSGFEAELSARSYALTVQVVRSTKDELDVYRRWWSERRVDGVIVTDLREGDVRLSMLEELRLPAVVLGGPAEHGSIPHLWSNDEAAMSEAVRYLAALGHRRIAHVSGLPELLHTQARTKAFDRVCGSLGLTEAVAVPCDYTAEDGGRATQQLLIGTDRPTAIVYDNDVMAVAGLAVAQKLGLSVPRDLSIIAWDDSLLCRMVHPPLTALTRDIAAYGARAARTLMATIDGEPAAGAEATAAHLTPRGSTVPPS
ncbi:LacI family DNA-binding transcriptional regulator [Actinoplanes sp. NPDC026623]|uniref:LacI family DNA-binding transcriptional regulator n=1 Tax=Actinoplanes sp. NPDC026623 TaxID=3155610 RepID=UPI0033E09A77